MMGCTRGAATSPSRSQETRRDPNLPCSWRSSPPKWSGMETFAVTRCSPLALTMMATWSLRCRSQAGTARPSSPSTARCSRSTCRAATRGLSLATPTRRRRKPSETSWLFCPRMPIPPLRRSRSSVAYAARGLNCTSATVRCCVDMGGARGQIQWSREQRPLMPPIGRADWGAMGRC